MQNKIELVDPTETYTYKRDYAETPESEIEDYLDHFSAPLVGRVAYQERIKMRNDTRHQMEQVIGAYQELGSSRAEAVAETLQQFRQSANVSQIAAERNQSSMTGAIPLAGKNGLGLALKCFGITALVDSVFSTLLVSANSFISHPNYPHTAVSISLAAILLGCAPPILAGAYLGYRNSSRMLRAVLVSHLLLIIPVIGLQIFPVLRSGSDIYEADFWKALVWFGASVSCGYLGAIFGKWLKKSNILDKIDPPSPALSPRDPLF